MTPRICRYIGSDAVMISEFVDGSACTKPPVEGPCEADTGVVAAADAPPGATAVGVGVVGVLLLEEEALLAMLLKAARSTVASLAASAFFR